MFDLKVSEYLFKTPSKKSSSDGKPANFPIEFESPYPSSLPDSESYFRSSSGHLIPIMQKKRQRISELIGFGKPILESIYEKPSELKVPVVLTCL